jgi:Domain of Unknown Function (DUF1080)
MRLCIWITFAGAMIAPALVRAAENQPFNGRWDLTVSTPKESYPSWMEVTQHEGSADVRVVGRVASVHPAKDVKVEGRRLSFTSTEWFGKEIQVTWVFNAVNGRLTGTQKREDGVQGRIVGEHAPALNRHAPTAWGTPEKLFNGTDLTGWIPDNPAENHWKAINGELVNESPGANIRTLRKFQDYKLHIEYNCPKEGNSGIYQRGRYEVQVAYEKNDKFHGMGAIYGFIAPSVDLPQKPGHWETFDVTLVGRHVTVVRNGVTTINDQEIPGITGGALDSREAEANSLYIQGDHTGGMKYRNITISVPKS